MQVYLSSSHSRLHPECERRLNVRHLYLPQLSNNGNKEALAFQCIAICNTLLGKDEPKETTVRSLRLFGITAQSFSLIKDGGSCIYFVSRYTLT